MSSSAFSVISNGVGQNEFLFDPQESVVCLALQGSLDCMYLHFMVFKAQHMNSQWIQTTNCKGIRGNTRFFCSWHFSYSAVVKCGFILYSQIAGHFVFKGSKFKVHV